MHQQMDNKSVCVCVSLKSMSFKKQMNDNNIVGSQCRSCGWGRPSEAATFELNVEKELPRGDLRAERSARVWRRPEGQWGLEAQGGDGSEAPSPSQLGVVPLHVP